MKFDAWQYLRADYLFLLPVRIHQQNNTYVQNPRSPTRGAFYFLFFFLSEDSFTSWHLTCLIWQYTSGVILTVGCTLGVTFVVHARMSFVTLLAAVPLSVFCYLSLLSGSLCEYIVSEKFTVYCICRPFSDTAKGLCQRRGRGGEFVRFRGQSQIKGALVKTWGL